MPFLFVKQIVIQVFEEHICRQVENAFLRVKDRAENARAERGHFPRVEIIIIGRGNHADDFERRFRKHGFAQRHVEIERRIARHP